MVPSVFPDSSMQQMSPDIMVVELKKLLRSGIVFMTVENCSYAGHPWLAVPALELADSA